MKNEGTLAIRRLILENVCDVCGRPRSAGHNSPKHTRCSKIRQQRGFSDRVEK